MGEGIVTEDRCLLVRGDLVPIDAELASGGALGRAAEIGFGVTRPAAPRGRPFDWT